MALLAAAATATGTGTTVATSTSQLVPIMSAVAGYCIFSGVAKMNHRQMRMNQLNYSGDMPVFAQFRPYDNIRLRICRPLYAKLYDSERFQIRKECHSFGDTRPIVRHMSRISSASSIGLAALDVKCSAVQTLPHVERGKTITTTPVKDKMKSPELDDSGPKLPPHEGGGGGGGGGGGEPSSGGFFLFAFLLLLSYLKDKESKEEEEEYRCVRTYPSLEF